MPDAADPDRPLAFWECYAGQRITAGDYAALLAVSGSPRVCATLIPGRCGSTLLASLVARLACCGRGNEVFNERSADRWRKLAATAHGFLKKTLRRQQLGGVFWFQAAPHRYDHLLSGFDAGISPTWRLSAILRRDIVAQAISYVYAVRSGIWHSFSPGYDPATAIELSGDLDAAADEVLAWVERIAVMETRIRDLLREQAGPAPLVLFYEDIVRDPEAAVGRFCDDAGVALPARPEPSAEPLSRLAKRGAAELRGQVEARHRDALDRLAKMRAELLDWAEVRAAPPAGG